MAKRKGRFWIQAATDRMRKKGTLGAFGRATAKKVANAKRRGGLMKRRAIFAQNMRKINARRFGRSSGSRRKSARAA